MTGSTIDKDNDKKYDKQWLKNDISKEENDMKYNRQLKPHEVQ